MSNHPASLPRDIGVIACYEHGWHSLVRAFWPLMACAAVLVVAYVPYIVLSFAGNLLSAAVSDRMAAVGTQLLVMGACFAYILLLILPLLNGMIFALLKAVRGQAVGIEDAFAGFRRYGAVVATMFVYYVVSTLLALACLVPFFLVLAAGGLLSGLARRSDDAAIAAVGVTGILVLLLCMIPMILISLRLYFTFFCLMDGVGGPMACLTTSWRLTRGRTLHLFLLAIAAIPVTLVGLLALCVGYIPAITWVGAAFATSYVAASGTGELPTEA